MIDVNMFQSGLNGEHTWGDAPVLAQMYEECLFDDSKRFVAGNNFGKRNCMNINHNSYDSNGNIKGAIEIKPPPPMRLEWNFIDQDLQDTIEEAFVDSQKIIEVKWSKQLFHLALRTLILLSGC